LHGHRTGRNGMLSSSQLSKLGTGVTNAQCDDGSWIYIHSTISQKVMLRASSTVSAWAREMLPPTCASADQPPRAHAARGARSCLRNHPTYRWPKVLGHMSCTRYGSNTAWRVDRCVCAGTICRLLLLHFAGHWPVLGDLDTSIWQVLRIYPKWI
jgi:hypothetical protein